MLAAIIVFTKLLDKLAGIAGKVLNRFSALYVTET